MINRKNQNLVLDYKNESSAPVKILLCHRGIETPRQSSDFSDSIGAKGVFFYADLCSIFHVRKTNI
jgi:hypothetical protein